ncbi:BTB/POZ domain-containing protein [Cucumis melo var. makuwa]|uniref:BTB/POZ domain-containing protein n=1 Tax=Cucumis melo var. makuwa TaxID=1194695 RepID=A0A5D3CLX4_CUCMM|nr:BTB/POZ domain-containing protein [Cucumis melo var. makuwa]TYK12811.1 BTB/POZ domain-containing protein [Cucumis melo var. makuwa]
MKETEDFTVWQNLRAVDTIYEEDYYEFSSSTSSLSPPLSPPPPPPPNHLFSRVRQWCNVTGFKTDVCIRVNGQCFHLHKDPLASKSSYLKRQLAKASDVTLTPPLKITSKTFTLLADFCYGAPIVITPFNVAALRTAAELLEMSDTENNTKEENLVDVTEKYFRRVVAVNRDYASVVFRSCLELLPEAETMAYLGSRCLEAWSLEDEGDNGDITCFEDFKCVEVENFMVLASSLNRRFKCHDLIYNVALLYLKGHGGKITEDQKVLICNFIDCDKLSPNLLLHAVQNPLMPLRFVVRAMLIEQLNTRNSIFSTTNTPAASATKSLPPRPVPKDPLTLGAILKRDAAARESAKLKAAMNATNSRIRTLESQLSSMKKKLQDSEKQRSLSQDAGRGRSASFHYGDEKSSCSNNNNSKVVARGQRGSISSSVYRMSADFKAEYFNFGGGCKPSSDRGSSSNHGGAGKSGRSSSFGQRLMNGIKNVFRVSSLGETESKVQSRDDEEEGKDLFEKEEEEDGDDDIVVMRRNQLYVN